MKYVKFRCDTAEVEKWLNSSEKLVTQKFDNVCEIGTYSSRVAELSNHIIVPYNNSTNDRKSLVFFKWVHVCNCTAIKNFLV